ncbi:uncharacterized protein LOC120196693 [Hibiscus syriacus]|uniref:uncharacterized protein LOC120196693 n=1 Tax=Hibiscus syriacus TaxID=106335 RepID=UPI0019210AFA|nr:uncharacterized protein LOC120196693 [Hibiscus syriacus]
MLHILRFTAGLVIVLFFVLHALNSCSVHADQGRETAALIQKEFHGRKIGKQKDMVSKDSGKKNDAAIMSIEKSQYQPNNQVSGVNKLEAKTSETPRDDEAAIGNKDESKRLLEAAEEVVNLMNKDYSYRGPRRKPPINNHVPRH